jgi:hypothetical protein
MTSTMTEAADRCQIRGCPHAATVLVAFGQFSGMGARLCGWHKPTVEQALRRGVVAELWKIHGYYSHEIAGALSGMTGHTIRESTVVADLKWLGLTEAHRAAEARLTMAVALGEAGPNVVSLRKAR